MTEIEFSVFTGYIIRVLDKIENGNSTWYRCEAKGTVSTPNKGFNEYLKRHRFRFTIRARKNLKSGMYVTIVGQPNIWTSPRGFSVYSLEGVVLVDGAFTFKSVQSMLEGVGREYSPIAELPELLEAYHTAGYSPVQALVGRDVVIFSTQL